MSLTKRDRRSLGTRGAAAESQLSTKLCATLSVDRSVHLQTCDFVLYQQLATLQFYDLEIVDRRMGSGIVDFRFQGPVPPFQFRKMGLHGHVGGFSCRQIVA
jgi:hypothetical protein